MTYLYIILALGVLLLIYAFIEAHLLFIKYLKFPDCTADLEKYSNRKLFNRCKRPGRFRPGQGRAEKNTLRIAFFSDLHADFPILGIGKLKKALLASSPDIICFGGDLVSTERGHKKGLSVLSDICKAAAQKNTPVIFIRGNHDNGLGDDEIKNAGALLLKNSGLRIRMKKDYCDNEYREKSSGGYFDIVGLDDIWHSESDIESAVITDAFPSSGALNMVFSGSRFSFGNLKDLSDSRASDAAKRIIVGHDPDNILDLPSDVSGYFLSGHFHGGQIRLPFRLEFLTLRTEQLSRMRFYDGAFVYKSRTGFIARGVGCVLIPFRFLCPPEICVMDFS